MRIAAGREILCHDDSPTERRFRWAGGYRARARTNMPKLDLTYVVLGALWLVLGMILGIVMGASENFAYAPLHAHINLVGFTCHSIFGIAYRLWPSMKTSALAPFQFWIFVIATPVMFVGLYFTLGGGTMVPTIIGSIGVFLGAALFAVIVWQARAAD